MPFALNTIRHLLIIHVSDSNQCVLNRFYNIIHIGSNTLIEIYDFYGH